MSFLESLRTSNFRGWKGFETTILNSAFASRSEITSEMFSITGKSKKTKRINYDSS